MSQNLSRGSDTLATVVLYRRQIDTYIRSLKKAPSTGGSSRIRDLSVLPDEVQ
jgi:hypothetical protein